VNRQALLNFRDAMAKEVFHAATAMIQTRACSPELGRAVEYFTKAHEVACRELDWIEPSASVMILKKAMVAAHERIAIYQCDGSKEGGLLAEAQAILDNALAEVEGHE